MPLVPVERYEEITLMGWTGGHDINPHLRTRRSGLPFRRLGTTHVWNRRYGTDQWERSAPVRPLVAGVAVLDGTWTASSTKSGFAPETVDGRTLYFDARTGELPDG